MGNRCIYISANLPTAIVCSTTVASSAGYAGQNMFTYNEIIVTSVGGERRFSLSKTLLTNYLGFVYEYYHTPRWEVVSLL